MKRKRNRIVAWVLIVAMVIEMVCPFVEMEVKAAAQAIPVNGVRLQSTSDLEYFYQADGALHLVVIAGRKLTDYTLGGNYQVSATVTADLPAYDRFIGYYHRKNGQNFIALGDRVTDRKKKTQKMISIVRYSKVWKKEKMASLRRNSSSTLSNIYGFSDGGKGSFAESGDSLYLYTEGWGLSEKGDKKLIEEAQKKSIMPISGIDRSKNFGFEIDAKSLKIREATLSYSSPCEDTYAVYEKGMLYLADRAVSDGLNITFCPKSDLSENQAETVMPFKFQGDYMDISYKSHLTGIGISGKNIILSGHSVPFGHANAGMTGYDYSKVRENLFVVVQPKSGGKAKVKWLTNSSNLQNYVQESKLVKISDNKFAVIYCIGNTMNRSMHITYIDGQGKRIGADEEIFSGLYQFGWEPNPIIYQNNFIFATKDFAGSVKVYAVPVR